MASVVAAAPIGRHRVYDGERVHALPRRMMPSLIVVFRLPWWLVVTVGIAYLSVWFYIVAIWYIIQMFIAAGKLTRYLWQLSTDPAVRTEFKAKARSMAGFTS